MVISPKASADAVLSPSADTGPNHLGDAPQSPEWRRVQAFSPSGRELTLLLWNGPTGLRAIRAMPALVRGAGGRPELSATFVLRREPAPNGYDLVECVERAVLGLTATVAPPPDALGSSETLPLLVREVTFALRRRAGTELCAVSVSNGQMAASLTSTLEQADARALLLALDGAETDLELWASLTYQAGPAVASTVDLSMDLAIVHPRLMESSLGGIVRDVELSACLQAMIADGTVSATSATPAVPAQEMDARAIAAAGLDAFKRAARWLLEPLAPDERDAELGARFQLTLAAPHSMQVRFRARVTGSSGPLSRVEVLGELRAVLEDVSLDDLDPEHVHFVTMGEPEGRSAAVQRRVGGSSTAARFWPEAEQTSTDFGGNPWPDVDVLDTPALASTSRLRAIPRAELQGASPFLPVIRPPAPSAPLRHLPLADDLTAPLWRDRVDENLYWYRPQFVVVLPTATSVPDDSPFLFQFTTVGHDSQGRPVLEGSVRLSFERRVPAATKKAVRALPATARAKPVPVQQLAIELEIPFRDHRGRNVVQSLPAVSVETRGTRVTARFEVLDHLARVTYGALSQPGFQAQPVRASIAYTYAAYITVTRPVLLDRPASGALGGVAQRPNEIRTIVAARRIQRQAADVSVPCATFGALYLERRSQPRGQTETVAIGCQTAYLLGETAHQLYERLDLPVGIARGQVYRSLQSPGRFLFVPDTYRITRFGADDLDRAYRPSILLYSTIDVEDLTHSPCVILSRLEPSGGAVEDQRLREHLLQNHHPTARVEYLTALASEMQFSWSLPTGADALLRLRLEASSTLDGIDVSLTTDAFGLPQVQAILANSGISGMARVTLPDGLQLATAIRMHFEEIVGPFSSGAVASDLVSSTRLRLRNCIESPLSVNEVLLVDGAGRTTGRVPAALRLEPGAEATLDLPSPAARALPGYVVEPTASSLVEIRSFMEDLRLTAILFNRIDLEALGFTKLRLEVSITTVPGAIAVEFEGPVDTAQTAEFVLPFAGYVSNPSLLLVPYLTDRNGGVTRPAAMTWNLSARGYVVTITPELLALD